jgi:hypothetical protein
MGKIKIDVIANKRFEADALVGAVTNKEARPKRILEPQEILSPPDTGSGEYTPLKEPRVVVDIAGSDSKQANHVASLTIWCIEDMMDPSSHKSCTYDKWPVLTKHILTKDTDLVVAFGTAAFPSELSYNGCVSIGMDTYIHNPQRNPKCEWTHERTEQIIPSSLDPNIFKSIHSQSIAEAKKRLLRPPLNPADDLIIQYRPDLLSAGVVNITNYRDYSWADKETIEKAREQEYNGIIGSMETTHGVIRLASDFPFLYISGIADRVGHYDTEVSPQPYAQNFVASHNAAIALIWIIPEISDFLESFEV